jgi:flagellar basal body-associated protein FliL
MKTKTASMGVYSMRKKKNRTSLILIIVAVLLIICSLSWFLFQVFEGEKPQIILEPLPAFVSKPQTFTLHLIDKNLLCPLQAK